MKGYTYILECADGTYYTGSTKNIEKRVWEHKNLLGANYTKKKHPVKLAYFEKHESIEVAFYREKQIQNWSHAKKKALIENREKDLKKLSKKVFLKKGAPVTEMTGCCIPGCVERVCVLDCDTLRGSLKKKRS